jgi:hypothetical protein
MIRTEIEHRGPSLVAVATTFAALFLASLILGTLLAGGEHFPSPFGPEGQSSAYFSQHAKAVAIGAFLQFGAAIPLGIYTATAVSRLQFFGLRVAGVFIALFGGLAASFFLALSALSQWVLAQRGVAGSPGATRVLHWFAFASGGPGHVVPLGLLLAGISVTAGLTRRLPRWMMIFGLVVAAIAELSSLALVVPAAALLLPLARFPALVWVICAGALLPKGIPHAVEKSAS